MYMSSKLNTFRKQLEKERSKNQNKKEVKYSNLVPSLFDNVNFDDEYDKKKKLEHKKAQYGRLLGRDDGVISNSDEEMEFNKSYTGLPSLFDNVSFEDEYDKEKKTIYIEKIHDNNKDDFVLPEQTPPIPESQSASFAAKSPTDDSDEKNSMIYSIAQDFLKQIHLISINDILHRYNGETYESITENSVLRLICHNYDKELKGCSNIITLARNIYSVIKIYAEELDEFPDNPNLVVFKNCTLEIDTMRSRANSPKDYATFALAINYNRDKKKMPVINHFLNTVTGADDVLYERILQMIGYLLSGDNKGKCFFYLMGPRDCGKSVLCALLSLFYPTKGTNKISRVALGKLGDKFSLGNIMQSTLNICDDIPSSPLNRESVSTLKMLTGSSEMEGELKYVQASSFKPRCRLLFTSNYNIRMKESDPAFEGRIVYIPFMHTISKERQDKNILEKMKGELQAFFNISHEAYKRLVDNNYMWAGAEKFQPVITIANSGITINKEQNIRDFIADCCEFEEDAVSSTEDLKYTYERYCNRYNRIPIQGDRFSRELSAILPDSVQRVKIGNQKRGYKGIKLKINNEIYRID